MLNTSSIRITKEIADILTELDAFKKTWNSAKGLSADERAVLRHTATVESIGASTRIEGSQLSDSAVDDLLFQADAKPLTSRDAQEIASYAEALRIVLQSWRHIPLTEESIKELHAVVLTYSTKDRRHRGTYKKKSNHIEAFGLGRRKLGITFRTAAPADTPRLMKEIVAWTQRARARKKMHPLVVSAIFIIVFLEIHPFHDGHGRLSRLLTTMLLLKHGYSYASFSSLETIIERTKKDYYAALRATEKTIRTTEPDWQPWIVYFLKTLQKQKRRLERSLAQGDRTGKAHLTDLTSMPAAVIDITHARPSLSNVSVRARGH